VADQHATYGTKVIPSTIPEGSFTLDEILGNPTDLPIAEHTTDTGGQTLALFAAFDLVGLRFSPRIRDLPAAACTASARPRTWPPTPPPARCCADRLTRT
jgi:TnpA family transposase